jgi:tetratricopeptide (TPR) repeat protein
MLETVGKLDEAEKHFRELLKIEQDNPVVHFWLAKFLAKYRPSANKEALKEAQAALELPAKGGLSKQAIEQFIHNLRSKTDQKPTK